MHNAARHAVTALFGQKEVLHVVPQNVYEAWVVATRPVVNNGLGLAPELTHRLISRIPRFFKVLPDVPNIYDEWLRLIKAFSVIGVNAHDARIVAAMKVHGINHLLTFN